MPVKAAARRRRPVSVTSLIDVIFLLLLFFMLTSTFTKFSEVKLMSGGSGSGVEASDNAPLFLRLGAEEIYLNGMSATLADVAGQVRDGMADEGETTLIVDPEGADVTSQRLVDLLVEVNGIENLSVRVLE